MNSSTGRSFTLAWCLVVGILLGGCAMKVAPTGGPRDTEPAVVIETEPRNGATNVARPTVRFVFDDYVDRSVRNAITVLPAVRFQTSYAGDEIEISFTDSLAPATTYTVTLGTTWTDVRGNTPTQSYTIAFSTGAVLDSGVIVGKAYGSSLASATVLCYPNSQFDSDSFSPSSTRALYAQPLGTSGAFSLRGLADGRYRVVVVRDENRNLLVDGNEEYCIAPHDILVTKGRTDTLMLLLGAPLDTVGPIVQRVRAMSQHTVMVQLSEPVRYRDRALPVTLRGGDRLDTAHALWVESMPSDKAFIRVPRALDTVRYVVDVPQGVFQDSLGLPSAASSLAKPEDMQTRGSRQLDTAKVVITKRIPSDSSQDLGLADPLRVLFSQPVDTARVRLELWHTSERGAHRVRVEWIDPVTLAIVPTAPRLPQTWYTTEITLRGVQALNGTIVPDTTLRSAHRTQQRPPDPGIVRGRLVDSLVSIPPRAHLVLRLLDEKRRVVATQRIDTTRAIVFDAVAPGTYSIDVFDDRNGNGRYDHGVLAPWTSGEQWWPTSSTLTVRPRWTVDDLRVVIGL